MKTILRSYHIFILLLLGSAACGRKPADCSKMYLKEYLMAKGGPQTYTLENYGKECELGYATVMQLYCGYVSSIAKDAAPEELPDDMEILDPEVRSIGMSGFYDGYEDYSLAYINAHLPFNYRIDHKKPTVTIDLHSGDDWLVGTTHYTVPDSILQLIPKYSSGNDLE